MRLSLLLSSLIVVSGAASAHAGCTGVGSSFFPDQNDTTYVDVLRTGASTCSHAFLSGGEYTFSSIRVARKPMYGTLRPGGVLRVEYIPPAGFRGLDTYSLYVCGTHTGTRRAGCSTIHYRTNVQ